MGMDDEIEWIMRNPFLNAARYDDQLQAAINDYVASGIIGDARINIAEAFATAFKLDRSPKLDAALLIHSRPSYEIEDSALERFKGLTRVLMKVCKIRENVSQVKGYQKQVGKNPNFSQEDVELYQPAIKFFSEEIDIQKFLHQLTPRYFVELFNGGNMAERMKQFNQRDDAEFRGLAKEFLSEVVRRIEKDENAYAVWAGSDSHMDPAYERFCNSLTSLSRELSQDNVVSQTNTLLVARLNHSAEKIAVNNADCCITAPYGGHREASILYWLDPSVFVWELYACALNPPPKSATRDPFGLGIFVKAKGHHFSKNDDEDYLVFEGFPAGLKDYTRIKHLEVMDDCGVVKNYEDDESFKFPKSFLSLPYQQYSVSKLIYSLGLITAKQLGISKLFINTGHGNQTQQSVQDSVREILQITDNESVWDEDKKRLARDPFTSGDLASIKVGDRKFTYTHLLNKPAMDNNLVERLSKHDLETMNLFGKWSGEGFFDTWYWWNRFISDTYPGWSQELRLAHPYALSVIQRANTRKHKDLAPESFWNHGMGYCTGFEVDVEKECKRLHIS